jgi:hypothetical protein
MAAAAFDGFRFALTGPWELAFSRAYRVSDACLWMPIIGVFPIENRRLSLMVSD